ncbi:semaphorin-4A-like isoform X2 [Trachinotus anak]|uniref:semaphorin-4A-like isoform X2 n=1 Tax=Trachinotus anak TaxID=443729 RepID=UPI0039F1A36A
MTSVVESSSRRPLVHFSLPDLQKPPHVLSDDASTLYVGARDAVLSLDVSQSDAIILKRKVEWSPSGTQIQDCEAKGKNPTVDCPNFVRVLQPINSTHLYACGSFAYSPHDTIIDTETLTMGQQGDAKGRCPFSPFQRSTAVTVDGELFTATTSDFRGVKPQISRHLSKPNRPDVSQDSSVSVSLLEEPTFVSSSADVAERKLYFFFTEVGKEFSFVDELQIARVAQVCKDDVGGQRTLQKKWTSFAKAPLLCQSHRQLPFNVLQDVFTLQPPEGGNASETLFYGIFTSQWSSGQESAVCVFKLQDIRTTFSGNYRTFDMQSHQWSPLLEKHSYLGKCGLDGATDSQLAEVKRSFLTGSGVKPVTDGPLVVSSGQQYSRVAAMRTKAANGKQYTVLYLLTESGFLHKVALLDRGARVIEEIQVFTQPQLVKSMVLSSTKGVLYVGTSEGVTAVPVADCSIYTTCSQCLLATDPLCGWSPTRGVCTGLDSSPDTMVQDLENANVTERCQQTRPSQDTDVTVDVNEAVTLPCLKPSNLAALTWTSSQSRNLPEKLFIQSADGSLRFLATASTFGNYHCEAEEGGYKEVVVGYNVRQRASPRSMSPSPTVSDQHVPSSQDEPQEDIIFETPGTEPSGEPGDEEDTFTTRFKDETTIKTQDPGLKNNFEDNGLNSTVTSRTETHSGKKPVDATREEKSYYSELVVVSLLLVLCICILALGGLHMWRQRKTEVKTNPLVKPDADPELKVVD